jgi:hypothetical protein
LSPDTPEHLPGLEPDPSDLADEASNDPTGGQQADPGGGDETGQWVNAGRDLDNSAYDAPAIEPTKPELEVWFDDQFTNNPAFPEWLDNDPDMKWLLSSEAVLRGGGSKAVSERVTHEDLKKIFYAYLADPGTGTSLTPVPTHAPDKPVTPWSSYVKKAAGIAAVAGVLAGGTFLLINKSEPGEATVTASTQVTAPTETLAATVPPEEAPAVAEAPTETTPPPDEEPTETPGSGFVGNPATTILAFLVSRGSLVFTMTVEGDGQALAESPDTQWYQPIFEFDTADGAFTIDGTWAQGRPFKGRAFDENFKLIVDADITGEWISPDTMVITADNFGSDELPALVRVILGVRVKEADGTESNYGDSAEWEQ